MKPSRYQDRSAPIRRIADAGRRPVRAAVKASLLTLKRRMDMAKARRLAQEGKWPEIIDAVRLAHFREVMKVPFDKIGDVFHEGALLGIRKINGAFHQRQRRVRFHFRKDVGDRLNYDRFSEETQAQLRAYQDALIGQLDLDARNTIERVITGGLRAGLYPEEIVSYIRDVIGLAPSQAVAVMNFRTMLVQLDSAALNRALMPVQDYEAVREAIRSQTPLLEDVIDRITEGYQNNYLDYRAATIADTETVRAASMGLRDAYRQANDRGAIPQEAVRRYWQTALDEKVCPICSAIPDMNPDGVGLEEQFQSDDGMIDDPPAHVNCRCSAEYVTNIDMVPLDEEEDDAA